MKKIFFVLVIAFASCKQDIDLNKLDNNLLVATNYDVTANFSDYKTFRISDTLGLVSDNTNDSIITGSAAMEITARIRSLMNERGYTEAAEGAAPDLGVNVYVIQNIRNVDVIYADYWDDYSGYYDSWYWGYPGYSYNYAYAVQYSYQESSLNMELIDLKNAVSNGKLSIRWNAYMAGSYSQIYLQNTLRAIDQSFSQSPYLSTNF
jgi:hypothetical protein